MILDISISLVIAMITGEFFNGELRLFLLLLGAFTAIAPNIDFIIYLKRRNWKIDQFAHEHRDLLHYPILVTFLGSIPFFFCNIQLGIVWCFGTLVHFIHDTIERGWGIKWLYPFSQKYFTFVSYSPLRVISTKEEQRELASKFGNPDWFKDECRLKPRLVFELLLLLATGIFSIIWVIS